MASYFFEGFLDRLMDPTDSASAKLLRDATVFCVPVRIPLSKHSGFTQTIERGPFDS